MNLNQLQECRPQLDEIRVIGRSVTEGEAVSELVGMTRVGASVQLYALQFDGAAHEARLLAEEGQAARPRRRKRETRRQEQFGECEREPRFPFGWLRSIEAGGKALPIGGGSSGPIGEGSWRKILLLEEFLRSGYRPCEALACRDLSALTLTKYRLNGEYRRIPLKKELGPVAVTTDSDSRQYLCRKRLRLAVGGTYPRPYTLTDPETGAVHRFYIETVALTDVWKEAEEQFKDPRFLERMSPREFEEMKRRHYEALSSFCPRGMLLPAIEYEADEPISLQFYLQSWLDAPPDPPKEGGSTGMIVMMKAEQKSGRHGLPLKAAAVHCPVPADTAVLDLEIPCWFERQEGRTFTL